MQVNLVRMLLNMASFISSFFVLLFNFIIFTGIYISGIFL